jgi:hypothetical protein
LPAGDPCDRRGQLCPRTRLADWNIRPGRLPSCPWPHHSYLQLTTPPLPNGAGDGRLFLAYVHSNRLQSTVPSASAMTLLRDRIVCITGSSRGIGRGCAVECAKNGAKGLILHYYGDEASLAEIESLTVEVNSFGSQVCAVPGDIAVHATSVKVRLRVFYAERTVFYDLARLWMKE